MRPPPGRQQLSREFIAQHQRARIIAALAEETVAKGYRAVTVADIVRRAGIARNTFYENFSSKEDCFLAAQDFAVERGPAAGGRGRDRGRQLAGPRRRRPRRLPRLRRRASRRWPGPASSRRSPPGPAALARYEESLQAFVPLFRIGRKVSPHGDELPATLEETIIGGIFWIIYQRSSSARPSEIEELLPGAGRVRADPLHRRRGGEASLGLNWRIQLRLELFRPVSSPCGCGSRRNLRRGGSDYPPELSRLPPGRHGLPREFVVHNQRERLIAGLAEAVAENGYAGTTIGHITRHAAVSRRTFYEHFGSKDECFVAAYDTVMARARASGSRPPSTRRTTGPTRSAPGSPRCSRFLAAEPNLARLCMVEALVAGPVVVERYDAAIQSLVPYFKAGREGRSAGGPLAPLADHRGGPGRRHGLADLPPHHRRPDRRAGVAPARPGRVHPDAVHR